MHRLARITRLAAVIGLEGGALVWLLQLGNLPWLRIDWSNLGIWLRVTPAEDALAAMVWLAALGCAIWLAVSTLLYLAARASRVPALIRSIGWMTLPAIRKVSEGALAALLVTSTIAAAPVWAQAPSPVVVVVDEGGALLPPGFVGLGREMFEEARPEAETGVPPLPTLPREANPITPGAAPALVTVQTGDNLWTMSRRHLTDVLDRHPTNQEIAPYWRQVITRNQPNLISGNPDLIYAGEVIEMPSTG
ncbi:MAG: hypothetical protein MUP13_02415 [Thermoanaerobaculales bacterium]|nr:hypothetical protein [Thermoanaerobaculales bacterium]